MFTIRLLFAFLVLTSTALANSYNLTGTSYFGFGGIQNAGTYNWSDSMAVPSGVLGISNPNGSFFTIFCGSQGSTTTSGHVDGCYKNASTGSTGGYVVGGGDHYVMTKICSYSPTGATVFQMAYNNTNIGFNTAEPLSSGYFMGGVAGASGQNLITGTSAADKCYDISWCVPQNYYIGVEVGASVDFSAQVMGEELPGATCP